MKGLGIIRVSKVVFSFLKWKKNCPHFLELKGSLQVKALVQLFKLETALPAPTPPQQDVKPECRL